jgi:hypothetical protein
MTLEKEILEGTFRKSSIKTDTLKDEILEMLQKKWKKKDLFLGQPVEITDWKKIDFMEAIDVAIQLTQSKIISIIDKKIEFYKREDDDKWIEYKDDERIEELESLKKELPLSENSSSAVSPDGESRRNAQSSENNGRKNFIEVVIGKEKEGMSIGLGLEKIILKERKRLSNENQISNL